MLEHGHQTQKNVGIAVRDLEEAIESHPTGPNDIDKALAIAAKHKCHPLRGVATYGDVYKLTYLRGRSGILVMLAEKLQKD